MSRKIRVIHRTEVPIFDTPPPRKRDYNMFDDLVDSIKDGTYTSPETDRIPKNLNRGEVLRTEIRETVLFNGSHEAYKIWKERHASLPGAVVVY